ncbi:helix-turn-helix transcriptional regulator [Herminiimonas arsenitoxidans]|uniref:helix-turn-helix transcriptional regulator n=1 Tax=Herminiimonas arsenitoxidans TaxID=1809410 RepID=UPI0009710B1C|nr:YafY family protein [Herminiimonas arsenitoxidans]
MRRAERLFQIAQYLRGRRLTTAHQLSEWLAVSERTIYRDIRDLSLSGVPIEGEAGVGYRVKAGYDLQPLMFSTDEIEAMVTGMRMVQAWGGPQLAASSAAALAKITLALPREKRDFVEATPLFAPDFHIDPLHGERLETIRQAIGKQNKLLLDYVDAKQQATCRTIWPLALYFWGGGWSIAAWCETRSDFRSFRLDRISTLHIVDCYSSVSGRRLADFVREMKKNIDYS